MKSSTIIGEEVLIAIRRIIQSMDLHSRYLSKHYGMTGPQLMILRMLSNGHDIPIGDIAKAISLSQATVTGIVERLEKKGLLIRKRDSIDRRRVLTVLTQEGRQLLDKTPPLMQRLFLETFGGLQDWEQTMILCALQRLADIMNSKPERS